MLSYHHLMPSRSPSKPLLQQPIGPTHRSPMFPLQPLCHELLKSPLKLLPQHTFDPASIPSVLLPQPALIPITSISTVQKLQSKNIRITKKINVSVQLPVIFRSRYLNWEEERGQRIEFQGKWPGPVRVKLSCWLGVSNSWAAQFMVPMGFS